MEYESITPLDSDPFPLISLIVKALLGVSQKFIDTPEELTDTEKLAIEFYSIPLYAPLN
ncbi:hypothetical protein ACTFIR_003870 [Dictyostelium discoideum]